VASAYNCQFNGAISTFPALSIWKARAEPKGKFFAWLALHGKTLIADNMVEKTGPVMSCAPSAFVILRHLTICCWSATFQRPYVISLLHSTICLAITLIWPKEDSEFG
jgi:hypothetical protein